MSLSLSEVKSVISKSIIQETEYNREKFCTAFALISKFAGWTWCFKEITKDNIDATYNMLSNNCLDCVNKLTENDLMGKTISICCSTGRIKFHVTYYCAYESSIAGSVIVDITADID